MSDALRSLLLAIGDDELVIGHRHSEWTGFAPHIEEDVAFSSIAQDEIGHAAAFYSLIDHDPDSTALGRKPDEYRHAVLCERPNGDWSYTIARHWLYDHADDVRLDALERSSHADLAALATKIRREERYHLLHANAWLERVARGPVEARTKLIDALHEAFPEAIGLFEPYEGEEEAVAAGLVTLGSEELRARFLETAGAELDRLGLPTEIRARLDESAEFIASSSGDLIAGDGSEHEAAGHGREGFGGRKGRHTGDFDQLWDDLTHTYRGDPGATW